MCIEWFEIRLFLHRRVCMSVFSIWDHLDSGLADERPVYNWPSWPLSTSGFDVIFLMFCFPLCGPEVTPFSSSYSPPKKSHDFHFAQDESCRSFCGYPSIVFSAHCIFAVKAAPPRLDGGRLYRIRKFCIKGWLNFGRP